MTHRTVRVILAAAAAVAVLAGCGYFHTADVAGYVVDSESEEGINGATVTFFMADPRTNTGEVPVTATETNTSNGNDGYFSQKVIWENSVPRFGQEGDSGTIYVRINHPDYQELTTALPGVLSDTLNFVSNIEIVTAIYSVDEVSGRVVGGDGRPVNGVQVLLTLRYDDVEDEDREYTDLTATVDGEDGRFVLADIEWRDTSPAIGSTASTATATLTIDDPDYRLADGQAASGSTGIAVTLSSGDDLELSADVRATQTTFAAESLEGRVIRAGTSEGVNGVRVVLNLDSTSNEDEDYVATTGAIDGVAGSFVFTNVVWEDDTPSSPTSDTESGVVYIDDVDYYWASSPTASPNTRAVSLVHEQSSELSSAISVNRKPRTTFSATVQGRIIERLTGGADIVDSPVAGVEVTATFVDEGSITRTLSAISDANGEFSFFVEWSDSSPRDVDDGASDAADDTSIPEGEDVMQVDIDYVVPSGTVDADLDGDGTVPPGDANEPELDETNFQVKSWLTPNYLPTAVDVD